MSYGHSAPLSASAGHAANLRTATPPIPSSSPQPQQNKPLGQPSAQGAAQTQQTPPTASTGNAKPSLQGVRIKQRKRQVQATAKFDPENFRDALLSHLNTLEPDSTVEQIVQRLVLAGSQLELLKYSDAFFELYFAGGLLQPGGGYLDKLGQGNRSAVSVFGCRGVGLAAGFPGDEEDEDAPADGREGGSGSGVATPSAAAADQDAPVDLTKPINENWKKEVRDLMEVLKRMTQRYRYMAKPLEENAMPGLLTYLPKWNAFDNEKMAYATAYLIIDGMITGKCFQSLYREHVIKDDVALDYMTNFFKAYLGAGQTMDQLSVVLRKSGVNDILALFPVQTRDRSHLEAHFKKHELPQVLDYFLKRLNAQLKEETTARLHEMMSLESSDTNEDIIEFLKSQQLEKKISETDILSWTWASIMDQVDWTAKPEQVEGVAVKKVLEFAPVLEPFCQSAKTQVNLINIVQIYCYNDTRVIKAFPQILKVLYNADCLSDQAIIYWHSKGAVNQGKQNFLKAAEALVKFLEAQAEEESDEE